MTYSETGEQNYISERVKERIQEVKDKKLKELDLSGCKLTEVPGDVWELEQLEVLDLGGGLGVDYLQTEQGRIRYHLILITTL